VRLDRAFRLSLYLTLALAGLCLAVAERPFLPGIFLLAGPILALLLIAFLAEGRWALPLSAANAIGLAILAGWGVWIDLRLFQSHEPWRQGVPMPAALLPYIGPLLLVAGVSKLFRPKHAGDFWALQLLALMEVALACVLTAQPLFGALLVAYLVCAVCCLGLFHFWREASGTAAAMPTPGGAPAALRLPRTAVRPVRWILPAAGVSLVLFLLLPRPMSDEMWNPLSGYAAGQRGPARVDAETGLDDEIDVNRTGRVSVKDDVALVVTATDAAEAPKLDLDSVQRFRGHVLDFYRGGHWTSTYQLSGPVVMPGLPGAGLPRLRPGVGGERAPAHLDAPALLSPQGTAPVLKLYDLGPRQLFLSFQLQSGPQSVPVLAEPVVLHHAGAKPGEGPVISLDENPRGAPLFREFEGALVPVPHSGRTPPPYRQVLVPYPEADVGPTVAVRPEYLATLAAQPVPSLTTWTRQLAERLAQPGGPLTADDVRLGPVLLRMPSDDHPDGVLPPERWEKVARALADHLARSGEYTYTLDLRHQDAALDPTLDFLSNVKQGHCNRYSGGLALMLRSLGIPARVVLGYRGAESQGDGTYVVRESQSHSWVEVPIPRPGPAGQARLHWLALDPTPSEEAASRPMLSLARWWGDGWTVSRKLWEDLVVDYGSDEQEEVWSEVVGGLSTSRVGGLLGAWPWLVGGGVLAAALVCGWLLLRARRRRPTPTGPLSSVPFYRRLLAILARRRLRPKLSQTPREFADAVRPTLTGSKATQALAALPAQLADLFYRVRYGDRPLSDEEERAVGHRLDELESGLR
jgi:transglutaminase-like putative cysteine protease